MYKRSFLSLRLELKGIHEAPLQVAVHYIASTGIVLQLTDCAFTILINYVGQYAIQLNMYGIYKP